MWYKEGTILSSKGVLLVIINFIPVRHYRAHTCAELPKAKGPIRNKQLNKLTGMLIGCYGYRLAASS